MSDVFYLDDTGDIISDTLGIDLTAAVSVEYHVQKPDGLEYVWTANVVTLLTGEINYTMQTGDLDQAGVYRFHAVVEDASNDTHTFSIQSFLVASKYSSVCEADAPDFCT